MVRFVGVRNAARTVGVDERTLRSWLEKDGDADHDERAWRAAESLAMERMLTGLARDDPRGIAGWATVAGVAGRNLRVRELIARREQRHKPEPRPSWDAAWQALSMDRRRLLRDTVRFYREHPPKDPPPVAVPERSVDEIMAAGIGHLARMSDHQVARETARLAARFARAEGKRRPAAERPLQRAETRLQQAGGDPRVLGAIPAIDRR
jgi:hypothetical protein